MGDAYNNCSRRQASSHTKIFAELNRGFASASGIDNAIYSSIDLATAQKIISLARYLLATNGQYLPGILTWQYNHPLPYEDGITENVYHNLFVQLGTDESLQQSFFKHRCAKGGCRNLYTQDLSQAKVKKYFSIKKWGGKTTVVPNNKAIADANKYHGYFVLVSNKEKAPFECPRKYRKRETIESFFEAGKQHDDGNRVRVWNTDILCGRMLVQFVSLCYYEYLNEEIRKLKKSLGEENGDAAHDTKAVLNNESKLKSWLCNTPLYLATGFVKISYGNIGVSVTSENRLSLREVSFFGLAAAPAV